MNNDHNSESNSEQQKIPEDPDFEDIQQIAAGELTDDTTAGFLMVPYQDTENGERVPTLMSCDEGLINDPRAAYELYTSLAGMVPIGLAQHLEDMNLKGALNAIEYESRTTAGENPADVRHEFGWQVKTPTIYRYLDQQYIDEFFEEGVIQLSSFSEFRQHEDEMREDSNEGVNIVTAEGEEANISAVTATGMNSYVFCGSTIASESLMNDFEVDGYFKITDTQSFGKAIAKSLENRNEIEIVERGIEGFCEYTDGNLIREDAKITLPEEWDLKDGGRYVSKPEDELPEPLKGRRDETAKPEEEIGGTWIDAADDDNISTEDVEDQLNQIIGDRPLFIKDQSYQNQSEYRLLWQVDGEISNTIQIECPEALEYCEKVT